MSGLTRFLRDLHKFESKCLTVPVGHEQAPRLPGYIGRKTKTQTNKQTNKQTKIPTKQIE